MKSTVLIAFVALCSFCCVHRCPAASEAPTVDAAVPPADLGEQPPTVLVVLLVRNKAHVLPYFLSYFERLDYPKDRLALWIRSDHNNDSSTELLQLWLNHTSALYHSVDSQLNGDGPALHPNENTSFEWPEERFRHLIGLKEEALAHAHRIWADFVFFLDADVLLTNPDTLTQLTRLRLPIVAPVLQSESLYSNFWCGMSDSYYYQRTDEYKEIYHFRKSGHFQVPMVHSAVLVHLNHVASRYLTFDRDQLLAMQANNAEWAAQAGTQCRTYDGPIDDIIIFAISANCSGIPMYVVNEAMYGYILPPLESTDQIEQDYQQLINVKSTIVVDLGDVPPVNEYLQKFITYPAKTKLTLSHIYMINLERRPERRKRMEHQFRELGLDVEHFPAVDGKELNLEIIKEMGISFLPGYADPYNGRQMTMGEIGCFLSHYRIWEKMLKEDQIEALILEDDIRFEPYFKEMAETVLEQARGAVEYDMIYFGRKRLMNESEPYVPEAANLVHAGYSYWTLGYVLSLGGAYKLVNAKPLEKLLPVDEFLPIMFNRHPNQTWSDHFPKRDLLTYSTAPLLLFPTHYTGEKGYISDTEDSELTSSVATGSSERQAQLKSDREREFPSSEDNKAESSKKEVPKLHEEL